MPSEVKGAAVTQQGPQKKRVSTDGAAQKSSQSPGSRKAVGVRPEYISFPLRHQMPMESALFPF